MISVYYGPTGSTKTSCAVSGEGLIKHAELDAGALERAKVVGKVDSESFFTPKTVLTDLGRLSLEMVGNSGKGAVQVVHRYQGWREVLGKWVQWYFSALESEANYIVVDTGSKLWVIAQNALRQRIQDEVPKEMQGDRLKRLEYAEPNSQFEAIQELAKERKKNLIWIAHEGEVWRKSEATGIPKPDGWGDIQDEAAVVMRFSVEGKQAFGTFEKGPLGLLGMRMAFPTVPAIDQLIAAAKAITDAGMTMPATVNEVLAVGAAL